MTLAPAPSPMQIAEQAVREAVSYHNPGDRLDALLRAYRLSTAEDREYLFANLAFRLTCIPARFHTEARR